MKDKQACKISSSLKFLVVYFEVRTADGGTVVKVCATNREVAGSIPDGVIGIFH
jgi:hypothetical protein